VEDVRELLQQVAAAIARYRADLPEARVGPARRRADVRAALESPVPELGVTPDQVLSELLSAASPGLMASSGPRYFGFVVGGAVDAALLAELMTVGWDQVAFNEATSPAAIAFEDVAGRWLKELLGLPSTASVGFVTGAQAANTVGLAAGRWHVLRKAGWDVGKRGLRCAPPVRVVAGAERHATIDRALRLLGLGEDSLVTVPPTAQGAMDAEALAAVLADLDRAPTIICAQAGNVNTGACDDLEAVGRAARSAGAWLHVDGAFGLWAAATPAKAHLVRGLAAADSWACDGHKWLNVPYDSGYAFCAHPDVHATALAYTASYLTGQDADREWGGGDFVPESSRRARGFATWAALRQLGRSGVAEMVERCCTLAQGLAEKLAADARIEVVNDVVLNQVLVRVGDAAQTDAVERAVQDEGVVWLGATTWRGERLLRISISNAMTREPDTDACARALFRALDGVAG